MGLYKRDSVWWMSFSHQGKRYRRSTETEDKKLARRIFDKLKGDLTEGNWFDRLPGEDYRFTDLMDKYLAEYSVVNKAKSTYKRDVVLAKRLNKSFGDRYLIEITPAGISDYKVLRRSEGVSPRTINYELTLMSHAFNIAIKEWEWLDDNPVKRVKKERVHNTIERWLSAEEEDRLLRASPRWLQDITIFAIQTGLRQSELLDLKWSQLDMERRTITIHEQKNGNIDTLPLNATAMRVLMGKQLASPGPNDYVFPNTLNRRKLNRDLLDSFYKARDQAKIENFRFHDLRHTFATRLVQQGVSIFDLQKLGRWKTVSMVMRYAHHNPESLRAAIEVMDGIQKPIVTILSQSHSKKSERPYLRLVTS